MVQYVGGAVDGFEVLESGIEADVGAEGYVLDWHVERTGVLGPWHSSKIVTTDTRGILDKLGGLDAHMTNHEELAKLVKACRAQGFGFSGYTFFNAIDMTADLAAIEVIGKAWRGI